ncbi:MAG: hypothetical protein ACPG7F_00745 [Aggregatilineales bacterium]
MTAPQNPQGSLALLIRQLLDRGYADTATQVLADMNGRMRTGIVATRIQQLKDEAGRLSAAGQQLTPDNPVLRALVADLEPVSARLASRLDVAAEALMDNGEKSAADLTRRLAFMGLDGQQFASIAARWNSPDPEAIRSALTYLNSQAWRDQLAGFGDTVIDSLNTIVSRGIVHGWNPVKTADIISTALPGVPARTGQNLMRTLQLTSYRDATAIHHAANVAIIEKTIRIAALDSRTCMSCVNLHGSVLKPGDRVHDHHMGRCTSIAIIKGSNRSVQPGEDWFNALPEARQIEQMGRAKHRAWKDGKFAFSDLSENYTDPVFGDMIKEASLVGILGEGAKAYYGR